MLIAVALETFIDI